MFTPMPRPVQPRTIEFVPRVTFFKPAGISRVELAEVALTLDELVRRIHALGGETRPR